MNIKFEFNAKKGVVLLETLLEKVGRTYDYKALLKLAFFADRYHIRNYARPISGEIYYAMKHGPVASNLKDILETQDFYKKNIKFKDNYLVELQSSNINTFELSKSDIEAVDFAVSAFGEYGKNVWKIVDLSHAYPEWDQYRGFFDLQENLNKRKNIEYKDFLKNAPPNHIEFRKLNFKDPFIPLTESDREDLIAEMEEISQLYG